MGLFDSTSSTENRTVIEDRVNNVISEDQGRSFLNAIGGIKVQGGGKKSRTQVTNNINLTDGGTVDLAATAIGQGFDVTSQALEEVGRSRRDSIDTAMRALDLAETRSGSEGLDLLKSGLDSAVMIIGLIGGAVVLSIWLQGRSA